MVVVIIESYQLMGFYYCIWVFSLDKIGFGRYYS